MTYRFAASLLAAAFLFCGCLSKPRDFASPPTTIRVFDINGTPMAGVSVRRSWYDGDALKTGDDRTVTDDAGIAHFPIVPANVGVFTGSLRKAVGQLGPCAASTGTSTTVYVVFKGEYEVSPKGKTLQPTSLRAGRDSDGVYLRSFNSEQANTIAELHFPSGSKVIDYSVSAARLNR